MTIEEAKDVYYHRYDEDNLIPIFIDNKTNNKYFCVHSYFTQYDTGIVFALSAKYNDLSVAKYVRGWNDYQNWTLQYKNKHSVSLFGGKMILYKIGEYLQKMGKILMNI